MEQRERIASDILGKAVRDNDKMHCQFREFHSHSNGPRDMRVCLSDDGGKPPTFHCFHSSCEGAWASLNKELRRRIWFAENGRKPDSGTPWNSGRKIARRPEAEKPHVRPFDLAMLRRVQHPGLNVGREWLAARSVIKPKECNAISFLEHLYLPGEKVLIFDVFKSQGQYIAWIGKGTYRLAAREGVKAARSDLPAGGPRGIWFLCQPVDGRWHPNPRNIDERTGDAKLSRRAEESVTDWRYMVLESDSAPVPLWLNFIAQLPLPIAAIYTSAGRSIHVLIRVTARNKAEWDTFKQLIVGVVTKAGADPGCLSAVRLTRLPFCTRGDKGGRLQELLYLNPDPDPSGCPIYLL